MNRIPTEGLKPERGSGTRFSDARLNEQNPDRGIETDADATWPRGSSLSLNEQNPDRGIETLAYNGGARNGAMGLNEQNPDRGIETARYRIASAPLARLE